MSDRGRLLVTLEDGTKIYSNGIQGSRGYAELNVGIYNFSAEFNPNSGQWNVDDTSSFVTKVGKDVSLEISPGSRGSSSLEVSVGRRGVDVGVIITETGDVKGFFGLGGGNDYFGAGIGIVVGSDPRGLQAYSATTVSSDGSYIVTNYFPGGHEGIGAVHYVAQLYDANGNKIGKASVEAVAEPAGSMMAAGLPRSQIMDALREKRYCFPAGTSILLPGHGERPIESFTAGDEVAAFATLDGGSGQGLTAVTDGANVLAPQHTPRIDLPLQPARVVDVIRKTDQRLIEVETGDGNSVRVTPGHRFLRADGEFVPVGDMAIGDLLVDADGAPVPITSIEDVPGLHDTYNLTIADYHTYVAAGYEKEKHYHAQAA